MAMNKYGDTPAKYWVSAQIKRQTKHIRYWLTTAKL